MFGPETTSVVAPEAKSLSESLMLTRVGDGSGTGEGHDGLSGA
jgi:hypothetical protein